MIEKANQWLARLKPLHWMIQIESYSRFTMFGLISDYVTRPTRDKADYIESVIGLMEWGSKQWVKEGLPSYVPSTFTSARPWWKGLRFE
jgi:hypothetical protein